MKRPLLLALPMLLGAITTLAQPRELRLETSNPMQGFQEFGTPMSNLSVTGEPIIIAGEKLERGIGTHSESRLRIETGGKATKLNIRIGIADSKIDFQNSQELTNTVMTDGRRVFYRPTTEGNKQFAGIESSRGGMDPGSVIFIIKGDGKELYNSGLVKAGEKARKVETDLTGIRLVELIANDGGDGTSGDRAVWGDPTITYEGDNAPRLVDPAYAGRTEELPAEIEQGLRNKIAALPTITFPLERPVKDWLLDPSQAVAKAYQARDGKELVLSNGLVARVFRITPNISTVDYVNQMLGESMIRTPSTEGELTIDGQSYPLGGLSGAVEYGYTKPEWVDGMSVTPNSFRLVDLSIDKLTPHLKWANSRWSAVGKEQGSGTVVTFSMQGPGALSGVKVKLHYALYDGLPCVSKWFEIENQSGVAINLDSFKLEELPMVEPESPVEQKNEYKFLKYNIHIESNHALLGFTERESDKTEIWTTDPRYTSQCNYPMVTPCMLEVKLPLGPDVLLPAQNGRFTSFRVWEMPHDSRERERMGLFQKRMYKTVAPWTTENPIFMHCTSSDPKVVRTAIDQCAETGYEMVILSFGSGLNMESENPEYIAKIKELVDYAKSKGIELGGYSLLSSRWISDSVDVINPETGKRGGMIFGSSPCLSSDWGYDYFRRIKNFMQQTGMTVFENDGSYPGNVCASTTHAHHRGLNDSQWLQKKKIDSLYNWMCESGIYTNVPDYYLLSGTTKVGVGYREVNWSLPRERQLVLGRQVMYDGLWERLPSMCWTFVPLVEYHGGGAEATLEPLNDHLDAYVGHMMQNYGSGVQACYRGHRLYDTDKTKEAVKEVINWYKKYRNILNTELIHLRRPDGRDWDGVMHISPTLQERGLAMIYNPTSESITRRISLPLYYTGLTKSATIREKEGKARRVTIERDYSATVEVTIAPNSYTWLVIEK